MADSGIGGPLLFQYTHTLFKKKMAIDIDKGARAVFVAVFLQG